MNNLKYVLRKGHETDTVIRVDDIAIGRDFLMIAGPCSVESETQIIEIAEQVKKSGGNMLRGGAFKPRTSPYAFQGLGKQGLIYLKKAKDETGLPVVTEVMDTRDVELVASYADVLQIGARNMQNFPLLLEVGRTRTPVLLKRGAGATIEEWLNSAEYIMNEGNTNVILCERGIRTHESYTRNTLDLSAVAAVKQLSHLPVVVDPSHGTGRRELVERMALSAIMAGCDGLEIEVHNDPSRALSDAQQQLFPKEFAKLTRRAQSVLELRRQIE